MAVNELLYLYAGENKPRIKLTCTHTFRSVESLAAYMQEVQDNYYLELQTCMTITDNLKIYSNTRSADDLFYILEFNEVNRSLYLWKSEGSWDVNDAIASFYSRNVVEDKEANVERNSVDRFLSDRRCGKYLDREEWRNFIRGIDFNWAEKGAMDSFWGFFLELMNLEEKKSVCTGNDVDSEGKLLVYRSLIILSILKTRVLQNKIKLKATFLEYYNRMAGLGSRSPSIDSSYSSAASILEENIEELKTCEGDTSQDENELDINYLYEKPVPQYSMHDKNKINRIHKKLTTKNIDNSTIVDNFNKHFKYIIDDYETYHLKFNQIKKRKYTKRNSLPSTD
ncbi:hypothetical protein TPHA_0I02750 [Tetrapisispora phaffii CBS 4417]|uniref:Uncharacterized protein n=1 Tax=Tetrapisispora phaffii (strain ATCC 24235 / CBS 4417 / NBRC 1672 / NRRL Y-8282 / UCD 70-5) TaxID=1071381 RepID=G8BXZ8_TETPH|nr:hypothetical protein TPHA_0I02750 [Tetrapisispora phaffii CBS 4417]CCE64776.1 hypothetical protein TPHA_0I02750 [Tetrapisispora phaffii CBS 4417]